VRRLVRLAPAFRLVLRRGGRRYEGRPPDELGGGLAGDLAVQALVARGEEAGVGGASLGEAGELGEGLGAGAFDDVA